MWTCPQCRSKECSRIACRFSGLKHEEAKPLELPEEWHDFRDGAPESKPTHELDIFGRTLREGK